MKKLMGYYKSAKKMLKKAYKAVEPKAKRMSRLMAGYSLKAYSMIKALSKELFTGVIRPLNKDFGKFVKRAPRAFAAVVAVCVLSAGTVTVALATEATSAYNVVFGGETIATVLDAEVLAEAEILAAKKLDNASCNKYIVNASLSGTVAPARSLSSAEELSGVLIKKSGNIVKAAIIYVDGKEVATEKDAAAAGKAIEAHLLAYKQEKGADTVKLSDTVTYKEIYTTKDKVNSLPGVAELVKNNNALPVHTVTTVTETRDIAYKTVETKSNAYSVGTKVVVRAGKKGSEEVTYEVYSVDGKVVSKKEVSSKVLVEAVDKKVTVGSRRVVEEVESGSYPMIWPLKRVSGAYVSSYVGDGRGHKGMDLVSPTGTPIYAAEAGKVIASGWDRSGYGYKIVIEHKNGISTLYAHCSALYVKVGDQVAQGETIAAVGNTGRSTGSHLHFEVRKNGSHLNPAKYIGRK